MAGDYTVTTNLLLNPSSYIAGAAQASLANDKMASSIKGALATTDASYGVSQGIMDAYKLSLGTTAEAAVASADVQVAAADRVVAANTAAKTSLMGAGAGGIMAALGLTFAIGAMVKSAISGETQLSTMKTALENLGLGKVNSEFVDITNSNVKFGFSTNDTADSLQKFATMTKSAGDAVRLNNLAMDMARARHTNLATAGANLTMMMRGAQLGFTRFGVTLDSTLPRTQAVNKALNEVQQKVKGQMQEALNTTSGRLDVMKASFGRVASVIGTELLPVINALLGFFMKFLPEIAILLGVATAIYTIHKATVMWAAAQKILDEAWWANPTVLIVGAIIVALALLWNHFKVVRDIIVDIFNVLLHTFGDGIKIIGRFAKLAAEYFLLPLTTILKVMSHLPMIGKLAKAALKVVDTGINDIGVTADKVGNKINSFDKTINKLRDMKLSNPFDKKSAPKFNDTSKIDVSVPVMNRIKKPAVAKKAAVDKTIAEYKSDLKTLNSEIDKARATLTSTRQKGSDAITQAIASSFGNPSEIEKAFDGAKATTETVLAEYEKLKTDIDNRTVGYANADRVRVLQALDSETNVFTALIAQRDLLDTEVKKAQSDLTAAVNQQTSDVKKMADSLISYGTGAGILTAKASDTVIRIIQSTTGAIVTQGADAADAVANVTTSLQKHLETMQTFLSNIKSLQARGLDADYIKQLIDSGIDTSGNTVTALAGASDAQLAVINSTYKKITTAANTFASTTGKDMYSAGVTTAQDYLNGLEAKQADVQAKMTAITTQITSQLAAIAPMSANIGKDTATALLNNLATYINDPKNKAAVLKNVTDLANQIKAILADALKPPTMPTIQPPVPIAPPPPPSAPPPPGSGSNPSPPSGSIYRGRDGKGFLDEGSGGVASATPNTTVTFHSGAVQVAKDGTVSVDPTKVVTNYNVQRLPTARNLDM